MKVPKLSTSGRIVANAAAQVGRQAHRVHRIGRLGGGDHVVGDVAA